MIHEMKLREVYFNLIKEGKKIYEIRLNDEKRQQIDVGDYIVFQNQSNTNECITGLPISNTYISPPSAIAPAVSTRLTASEIVIK